MQWSNMQLLYGYTTNHTGGRCTYLGHSLDYLSGLYGGSYAERLQILGLQTLEHRLLLAHLPMCFKIKQDLIALNLYDFFSCFCDLTRGHTIELTVKLRGLPRISLPENLCITELSTGHFSWTRPEPATL